MDLNLTPPETKFRDELRAWQKCVYQAGRAGVACPKEYGGRGASLMEQVTCTQDTAAAGDPPLANILPRRLHLAMPPVIATEIAQSLTDRPSSKREFSMAVD
jgi:alkylation response protein AidB-like acyl-CoA dehydrogenase